MSWFKVLKIRKKKKLYLNDNEALRYYSYSMGGEIKNVRAKKEKFSVSFPEKNTWVLKNSREERLHF